MTVDITNAVLVVGAGERVQTAADVLLDEVEARTGIRWNSIPATNEPDNAAMVIRLAKFADAAAAANANVGPEGFVISVVHPEQNRTVVSITGADDRGVLFGVGYLIRSMDWRQGSVRIPANLNVVTTPEYPFRGHQLGYRPLNNTWDAWTPEQFEQYIRDLALFGSNAVENIPFGWDESNPLMKVSRREMNRFLSETCDKYDLDYWFWTPADYDLEDEAVRAVELTRFEDLFATTPRLNHILIPGADPGDNHPRLVVEYAREVAELLHKHHPNAGLWISMQGYVGEKAEYFTNYLRTERPEWLAGVVAGPQAYRPVELRRMIPAEYPLRQYPDVTHTIACQYPTPWWDLAFERTLGRESANPRPVDYAAIIRLQTPHTVGFLTYSDGAHDDVNKVVWNALGWELDRDIRDVLIDYCRTFFGADVAERAADGIFALERNWQGPIRENGGIDATLAFWQALEREHPELNANWRWNLLLLRAYYDTYTRHRARYEQELERRALTVLSTAETQGADAAVAAALEILALADSEKVAAPYRERAFEIAEALNQQIGLQTSVELYGGLRGRGNVIDDIDAPLNDRAWLTAQFEEIRALDSEQGKLARLETIRTWNDPGPGGYYDNVGQVGEMPHIVPSTGYEGHPANARHRVPHFRSGQNWKFAWHVNMHWPVANFEYADLNPSAEYVLRFTGVGALYPKINGERLMPITNSTEVGVVREFAVPKRLTESGRAVLTWDDPNDRHLNWRQWSRLHEIWFTVE